MAIPVFIRHWNWLNYLPVGTLPWSVANMMCVLIPTCPLQKKTCERCQHIDNGPVKLTLSLVWGRRVGQTIDKVQKLSQTFRVVLKTIFLTNSGATSSSLRGCASGRRPGCGDWFGCRCVSGRCASCSARVRWHGNRCQRRLLYAASGAGLWCGTSTADAGTNTHWCVCHTKEHK